MTITEFLSARLTEDEAAAKASLAGSGPWTLPHRHRDDDVRHIARHDPARVLREIEVKRYLIAVYEDANGGWSPDHFDGYWDAVWRFAAVYSDHPDYDPAWALEPVSAP